MRLKLFLFIALWGVFSSAAKADSGSRLFERGRAEYFSAKKLAEGGRRDHALKSSATTLRKFLEVYKDHPKTTDALFNLGSVYEMLALGSEDHDSASTAIHYFKELVQRFPKDRLADDSLLEVAKICMKVFQDTQCSEEALQKIRTDYHGGDVQGQLASQTPVEATELKNIQTERTDVEFKVRISLNGFHSFNGKALPASPDLKLPERFYVDIEGVRIAKGLQTPALDNGPVSQIRFGQNGNLARVVIDLVSSSSASRVKVETDGADLVMRVPLTAEQLVSVQAPPALSIEPKKTEARKIETERFKIVVDAGHGGEDTGARGKKGTLEKEVCLSMAKRVVELLKARREYEVFETRPEDKYITLADRTKISNNVGGDLFVSIHANASPRHSAEGVSTYFLDNHDDAESLRVAMRENSEPLLAVAPDSPTSDSQYLEIMKASMVKNFHTVQSTEFARNVQLSLLRELRGEFSGVQDLGVRSARFYVLTGAMMPAILVETSFISNPKEEKRLSDSRYQKIISRAIVRGIDQFFKSSVGKGDHAALYQ